MLLANGQTETDGEEANEQIMWEVSAVTDSLAEVIKARSSPTALAALDALHAALWLLAVGEVPQSLSSLHHAIELALKGLLEEIHIGLTDRDVANKDDEYDCLKHILAVQIRQHPLGQNLPILGREKLPKDTHERVERNLRKRGSYDPDRTVCFPKALKRVREMLSLDTAWEDNLGERCHELRNEIVHWGAKPRKEKEYLEGILTIALPFLEEFYRSAYNSDLRQWLIPVVARELLDVAPKYLRAEKRATCLQVLYTFRQAWWWIYRYDLGRTVYLREEEQRGWLPGFLDGEQQDRFDELRSQFVSDHVPGDDYFFDDDPKRSIDCRICSNPCFVVADPELYEDADEKFLEAKAVHCPNCGLEINGRRFPSPQLAAIHVGPITREMLGEDGWKQVLRDLSD